MTKDEELSDFELVDGVHVTSRLVNTEGGRYVLGSPN
jgi:hypothetical protein